MGHSAAAEEGLRRLDLREPLGESQMTVPETPSPDMAFLKGNGRRQGPASVPIMGLSMTCFEFEAFVKHGDQAF